MKKTLLTLTALLSLGWHTVLQMALSTICDSAVPLSSCPFYHSSSNFISSPLYSLKNCTTALRIPECQLPTLIIISFCCCSSSNSLKSSSLSRSWLSRLRYRHDLGCRIRTVSICFCCEVLSQGQVHWQSLKVYLC